MVSRTTTARDEEKAGPADRPREAARIDVEGEAFRQAEEAALGRGAGFLERLAERIGANAGVRAAFGQAVERDGRTVIPVARSVWGTGGGSGESEAQGSGSGGGGGAASTPMGYIEMSDIGVAYVPLGQPWQDPKVVLAWAFAIWLVARGISRLLRG